jgi:hypothetical protein
MRNAHHFVRVTICAVSLALSLALALPALTSSAQGRPSTLVGRAVLPADTLADGPRAGQALAPQGETTINGMKLPFDSQPVGSVSAILPGEYSTWLLLSDGVFDTRQNSGDYLLRIYTVEISLHRANGGDGTVAVLDWRTLSDPSKKIKQNVHNGNTPTRELTGEDFDPRAFQRAGDGSFWVAEAYGPSLLHFNADGRLLEAPIALGGAGALQGLGIQPDGNLLIAQRARGSDAAVVFRAFDISKHAISAEVWSYPLADAANDISELTVISDHEALAIEQDEQQNKNAKFKRVFLVNFSTSPASKALLIDLLNVADPGNVSTAPVFSQPPDALGLGQAFKFPYGDVAAAYPVGAGTLMVVNNNHVPFGTGRSANQADDTDLITIQLAQPLKLDPSFRLPQ